MAVRQHYAVLDGLRGIAALGVLILHVAQQTSLATPSRAALAVDFFYLLSGFVVAYAYESRLRSSMTFRGFMTVRLVRLYPLLFAGVSAGIALAALASLAHGTTRLTDVALAGGLGLLTLPSYVFSQWGTAYPFNMAEWSLFFEFFVSAVFAIVVRHLTAVRLVGLVLVSAVGLIVTVAINHRILGGNNQDNWGFGFGRVFFPFFCGVLIYRFHPEVLRPSKWQSSALMVVLGIFLLVNLPGGGTTDLVYVLILFPILVWRGATVYAPGKLDGCFLVLGQLSYPVYILQFPVLKIAGEFTKVFPLSHSAMIAFGFVEISLVTIVAYGALKFFDEPVRSALSRRLRTRLTSSANVQALG